MKLKRSTQNPLIACNPANTWETGTTFNPSVLEDADGVVRMLYRATAGTEWWRKGEFSSSLGLATNEDGVSFTRGSEAWMVEDQDYEYGLGCEDPRAVRMPDGTVYIFYTAVKAFYDEKGDMCAPKEDRLALATTTDFSSITKHGIIGPPGISSKAAALFPEPIGGAYRLLFTAHSDSPLSSIVQVELNDLEELKHLGERFETLDQADVLIGAEPGMRRGPELGAPPVKTDAGWLLIYCGGDRNPEHPEWTIDVALLDLDDPTQVVARTAGPLLTPETLMDRELGVVRNVVFPSGAIVRNGTLHVYYGSGDKECHLATCDLRELLSEMVPAARPAGSYAHPSAMMRL